MNPTKLTVKERVTSVLNGETPDRLPFIDRIELWYRHHRKTDTIPAKYAGMDLNEVHKCIGMGRQKFIMPVVLKLNGVEMKVMHNGEPLLHAQNKKMCTHADGNLKPLLSLLPESGLDIYESFSPWPLTELRFEEAWEVWSEAATIWGGIPSPILEKVYDEDDFKEFVSRFLEAVRGKPIIIGIGDQVMPNSLLERVEYISEQIENS